VATCPDCAGEKVIRAVACPGFRPIVLTCEACKGTGSVDDAFLARRADGERLRMERIARGLSLREEAKRLGISPVLLSDRERGRE